MYNKEKILATINAIYAEAQAIQPYVLIAQPRRDSSETPAQHFNGHTGLHVDLLGFSHGYVDISGQKVDVARNYLFEQFLDSGARYLFFIGEDTVVPFDAFKILHETAEKNPGAVVTGVYYIKASDAMIMTRTNNWITVPNVDPGQIFQAWQTGMDCMLIPRDIILALKNSQPDLPFCCIYNDGHSPFVGEDNFFVHRLREAGFKLLVNTDVQCLHVDLANGKYTAHPSVDLRRYFTNITITEPFTLLDREYLERRWLDRLPDPQRTRPETQIAQLIQAGVPVKLNLGSGDSVTPGWIHIDIQSTQAQYHMDVFDLKLTDNTISEIQALHLIEHLPHWRVPDLLTAWYRALQPTGTLTLELPDLQALCASYSSSQAQDRYVITQCIYGISANSRDYPHVWGYDPQTLTDLLKLVGFSQVECQPATLGYPGENFRVVAHK